MIYRFSRKYTTTQSGFTLTELIVTIAIISILTAIVMFRYNDFQSTALLQSQAYELALDIRQAQVFSLSVRSEGASGVNDPGFREEYGVYFSQLADNQYIFFQDDDSNSAAAVARYQSSPADEALETILMDPRYEIQSICLNTTPCSGNSAIRYLSITFKRPNFDARLWARTVGGSTITNGTSAHITISPINGSETRTVSVFSNGQVSVD